MTTARICRKFSGFASEDQEQIILADWLDLYGMLWCHVPNGGSRHPAEAAKLRRMGVKPGVPDIVCFDAPPKLPGCHGVAIELKSENLHSHATEHQEWWLERLNKRGWHTALCHGADEAIGLLRELGFEKARVA